MNKPIHVHDFSKGTPPPGANGTMPIKMGFKGGYLSIEIIGGPFDNYRPGENGDIGICVRAERVPATANIWVPIRDFDVPKTKDLAQVEHALEWAIASALDGKRVYVGCQGGWGRTGLFLALIAKVCGLKDPVDYVRHTYTPRAVETKEQQAYVDDFDVTQLQRDLLYRAWGIRWARLWFWWT
jgi:hypothetical protein